MTNEEAIKDIKESIKPYVGGISLDMAIDALESAERYKWHDLRKDPNDLPKPYEDIIFILTRGDRNFVGWINDDEYFDTEDSSVLIDKEVIKAWRYIEPFAEE